jgi:hypothetical protein
LWWALTQLDSSADLAPMKATSLFLQTGWAKKVQSVGVESRIGFPDLLKGEHSSSVPAQFITNLSICLACLSGHRCQMMRLAKEVVMRMVPFPTWPRPHTHAHILFCTEPWYGLLHDLCVRLCNFATAVKLSLASGKSDHE